MRQRIVKDRVLGVEPFPVKHVTIRQQLPQFLLMRRGPGFEERELALTRAAVQKMPTALQKQTSAPAETYARVRAVKLLFDHDVFPAQICERRAIQIVIAGLKARAFDVRRARVFVELFRHSSDLHHRDHVVEHILNTDSPRADRQPHSFEAFVIEQLYVLRIVILF